MKLNTQVSEFLNAQNHPFRKEIEQLRISILSAHSKLEENIKWNGPNYSLHDQDRITMRIQPPTKIQLIFHRGARVKEQPKQKLIDDAAGLLTWKENDRAIATFKNLQDIENSKPDLQQIVKDWLEAAK
jgi:Domain of unknown function (DU1801)